MFKRVRFSFDSLHSLEVTKINKIFSITRHDVLPSLAPTLLLACTKPLAPANILLLDYNLCSNRSATITVNGTTSEPGSLAHAGLPQGSPLSPLLFLFFNANLVKSVFNKRRGTVAFVDDYSAWVTGDSINDNLEFLRTKIVSPLENWAAQCGPIWPEKSHMTHFTRNKKAIESTAASKSLILNGACIQPSPSLKLLGVVLD